VKVDPTILRKW